MILMRCDTQINHDIFVILLWLIKRFCQKWMLTLITKGNEYTELVSNVLFDNVGNIIVCILLEIQFSTMIIFYFCEQNTKLFLMNAFEKQAICVLVQCIESSISFIKRENLIH